MTDNATHVMDVLSAYKIALFTHYERVARKATGEELAETAYWIGYYEPFLPSTADILKAALEAANTANAWDK
jgi:hypothetical protein